MLWWYLFCVYLYYYLGVCSTIYGNSTHKFSIDSYAAQHGPHPLTPFQQLLLVLVSCLKLSSLFFQQVSSTSSLQLVCSCRIHVVYRFLRKSGKEVTKLQLQSSLSPLINKQFIRVSRLDVPLRVDTTSIELRVAMGGSR